MLRLYDVHTGKDLWRRTFSPKAMVIQSEESELTGIVEPSKDCRVTVIDLRTQKDVLVTRVSPKDLDKVPENGINLLRDNDYFFLAFNAAPDPAANPWGGPWSNLNPGMRSLMVNGNLYCFHRDTGKLNWKNEVSTQMIVLDQFKDLPVVLFTGALQSTDRWSRGHRPRCHHGHRHPGHGQADGQAALRQGDAKQRPAVLRPQHRPQSRHH